MSLRFLSCPYRDCHLSNGKPDLEVMDLSSGVYEFARSIDGRHVAVPYGRPGGEVSSKVSIDQLRPK